MVPPLAIAALLLVLPLLLMGWRIVADAIHRVFVRSVVAAAPLLRSIALATSARGAGSSSTEFGLHLSTVFSGRLDFGLFQTWF